MLVGRTSECGRIDRLLAEAGGGRGGALIVRGAPGIGKSSLLAYARSVAAGMRVLTVSGVECESELPFSALATLLRPLLGKLDRLVPMQRAALERALAIEGGDTPGRFGVGVATLSLLTLAAEESPVLALIDDAQWVDAPSADALLFAARRLDGDPVALLFAAREGEPKGFEAPGVPDLQLEGLDEEHCGVLLRLLLGPSASPPVVDRLTKVTGGNPLALVELPSLISPERLARDEPLDDPLPVGPRLSRAFAGRITALPPAGQRALGFAAISETGSMAEIGAMLRRLGMEPSALAAAEIAGLVRINAGSLHFRHPLLRAVAYHRLSAPDRRVAHLALAEVLAGGSLRTRAAWHLAAAVVEPDERIASELELAADEAHGRAAPASAGVALETAARLTPNDGDRVRRLMAAAAAFHLAGRTADALRALDGELERVADPLLRADVEHLRARIQMLNVSCVGIRIHLVAEADRIRALDQLRAAAMLIDASLVSVMAGQPREALALARRAHPIADRAGDPLALASCCSLGGGLLLCGEADDAAPLLKRSQALIEAEDLVAAGYLAVSVAQSHGWANGHAVGRDLLRRLIGRARRESVLTILPFALAAISEFDFHLGDWKSAYAAASESVSLAEEVGQRNELAHSLVRLAHIEAGQGSEVLCRANAGRAVALASELEVGSVIILAGTTLGLLELGLGRPREAIAELERTGRMAADVGLREPAVAMWAADLAEAHARVGEGARAEATLASLEEQALGARRTQALAAVARVRGLLASEADYSAQFAAALRWHADSTPLPFELARTSLCFGERLRRDRRTGEARDMLRAALAGFETLGAWTWADSARRELQASGEHCRAPSDVTSALTPQELQVAMLVIDGASNRDVAAALFISPKTVEVHLTRIYRKLGVRSRTQLARALRGGAEGAGQRRFQPEEHEPTRGRGA